MSINFVKIEKKWQKKWKKTKLFEANIDRKKKKFFTSLIIPYVNGRMHIGHSYTFTRTDIYARFKRMQGYSVLLAQGFHATGEPIVGAIERLKNDDKSQIETFKMFGATERDLQNFRKKGPEYVAKFWMEKMKEDSDSLGYSVDWRRTFITTAISPHFSRFIEWQYNTLRKKGYVVQGTHPVIWCPHDQSPTGDHDRLEGEGESPVEYTGMKFRYGDAYLICATLRPETIYGVTNIWVNPDATYYKINAGSEKWIVSRECYYKLKDQLKHTEKTEEVKDIIGKKCIDTISNKEISILPSHFVDPESATGIVMSVPAHAPYDWIALKEMMDKNELDAYGITKNDIEPIVLIDSGFDNAVGLCAKMRINSLSQAELLEEATKILYKKEFHNGILNDKCGTYTGMKVSESKEKIISDFIAKGIAHPIWDCNRVVCRCTTRCHVKILENQWFLKFSDEKWKDAARKCLSGMRIVPDESRANFENTIEWLKDKACARKSGLGTKLPWDKEWIVETLSDSTIYMAYYTIASIIRKSKIKPQSLTDEVFDYIFLGKGDSRMIKNSRIPPKVLDAMKLEFEYFYPVDMRNSAKDLIQNHLTFYIFHHTAIWPNRYWPVSISANGYVNVEGEKMSKSKGNFIVLKDVVKQYGADLTRINIACSSEGLEDADWRFESIKSYRSRIELISDIIKDLKKCKSSRKRNVDNYLLSRLERNKKASGDAYSELRFRTACQHALFEATNDLRWYLRRVNGIKNANRKVLSAYLHDMIKLLAPVIPHVSEEMWHNAGKRGFVSASQWPSSNKDLINQNAEMWESMLKQTISDVEEIKDIINKKAKKCIIFVAEGWKFKTMEKILKNKNKSLDDITKEIMQSDARRYGKATLSFIQSSYAKSKELEGIIKRDMQLALLEEAKGFLEKETGMKIEIQDAQNSEQQKAKSSAPWKFGILFE